MKKRIIYSILIVSTCFSFCKKNALPKEVEEVSTPEFYVKCQVNGLPVSLEAGINNYYMFSKHTQDTNDVYVYIADLKQKNCGNACGYGISIQINDSKQSALGEAMKPDSGLYLGKYIFNDGSPEALYYTATFTPELVGSGVTYKWNYADGTSQTTQQGSKIFRANTTQNVVLSVTQPLPLCSTTHTNSYVIGNPLQTYVTAVRDPSLAALRYTFGNIVAVNSGSSGTSSYSYLWKFGDGDSSKLSNPTHSYSNQGYYTAKLTLTDSNNNTCTSYYQAPCFNTSVCNANYNASFSQIPNPKAFSAITVKITDPNGVQYSSAQINQPSSTKFEITSVEDYKQNENGEATKKVKIKFNCLLQNGSNTLNISNGEAVIAVSYK